MKRSADWSDDRDAKKQQVEPKEWRKIEKDELNLTNNCDAVPLESVIFIDGTHSNYPKVDRAERYRDLLNRHPNRSACYNFISWLKPGLSEEAISAMYSQIDLWTRDGVHYFFRKPSYADLPDDALAVVERLSNLANNHKLRGAAKEFKGWAKPDCAAPILFMDRTFQRQIDDLIRQCGNQFNQIIVDGPPALEAVPHATGIFGPKLDRLDPLTNNLVVTSVGVSDALQFTGTNLHVNELVVGPADFNDDNWMHFFEWRLTKPTVGRWVIHQPDDPGVISLNEVVRFIRDQSNGPIILGISGTWDFPLLDDPRFDGFIIDSGIRSMAPPARPNVTYRDFGY